eukprot:1115156-Pelagomonas_calceolata.AAC.1
MSVKYRISVIALIENPAQGCQTGDVCKNVGATKRNFGPGKRGERGVGLRLQGGDVGWVELWVG